MGQYYNVAFKNANGFFVSDLRVKGHEYIGAKLMEHSYFGNALVDAIANILYGNKSTNLMWVGDYAEQGEVLRATNNHYGFNDIWGKNVEATILEDCHFNYQGKYFVNHDTKEFISFDNYLKKNEEAENHWEISPIPLLTAIGNGRGGGDFRGEGLDYVGSWAFNSLSIEDDIPKDYTESAIFFSE